MTSIIDFVQQDVLGIIDRLNQSLLVVQSLHKSNPSLSWSSILRDPATTDNASVQIAVINKDGILSSSTKLLTPTKLVDLSDREHFKFQKRNYGSNQLFISAPVYGRVTKRWVVQFTRPLFDQAGAFD
ncbi:MAG: hypothetical protein KGQ28_03285, partial [Hyphomicrobiales bacterium]|nr:hypothetical protein [Hyphomicrobiales bacterium]